MFNQDILLHVTSKTGNKTLEILSHTSLWNDIKKFAETSQFWKLRVEHLISRELKYSSDKWKKIYYILEYSLKDTQPFYVVDTSEVIAIQILLDLGHEPNALGRQNTRSVFYRAAESGHSEVVKLLLEDSRFDPSLGRALGEDALVVASQNGYTEVVKLLLSDKRFDPSEGASRMSLPLAIQNVHHGVVKLLLEDSRVDPLDTYQGISMLALACSMSSEQIIKLLLSDSRVDPSVDDNLAIQEAAASGHLEIVELLLSYDSVRLSRGGNKALVRASYGGRAEIIKFLLADPTIDPSYDDNQALRTAIYTGHREIVRLLLSDKRVDPQVALERGIEEGEIDIVKLVLEDPRAELNNDLFHTAVEKDDHKMVALLLSHHSEDLDLADDDYEVLRIAIGNGSVKIVKLLLAERYLNMNGALETACEVGNIEILKLLLAEEGIDPSSHEYISMEIAINGNKMRVIDLLLKDKRTDLYQMSRDVNFKKMLKLIFPLIQEKALGFFIHRDKSSSEFMDRTYLSFVLLLILRRPSFKECLKWMLLQKNKQMIAAARSLISGKVDHSQPLITAYFGFFLLAIPDMNLKKIQKLLREEGASKRGIDLASGLIGAYLGETSSQGSIGKSRYSDFTSEVLYEILE